MRDLAGRWQSDVLNLKPDWVSIMIGIHDVWRQFDAPLQTEWHVSLDEYSSVLEQLVRTTRPQLKGLVLMTPYFIAASASCAARIFFFHVRASALAGLCASTSSTRRIA